MLVQAKGVDDLVGGTIWIDRLNKTILVVITVIRGENFLTGGRRAPCGLSESVAIGVVSEPGFVKHATLCINHQRIGHASELIVAVTDHIPERVGATGQISLS